mgnify:CR=1 FL=1
MAVDQIITRLIFPGLFSILFWLTLQHQHRRRGEWLVPYSWGLHLQLPCHRDFQHQVCRTRAHSYHRPHHHHRRHWGLNMVLPMFTSLICPRFSPFRSSWSPRTSPLTPNVLHVPLAGLVAMSFIPWSHVNIIYAFCGRIWPNVWISHVYIS